MSVADEAGAVVSAVYWTNKAGVAVAKGAGRKAKGAHRKAQNIGMAVQNWRHKGAGEAAGTAPATVTSHPADKRQAAKRQNWTTDEETFKNTTTSVTTYTRKRTR